MKRSKRFYQVGFSTLILLLTLILCVLVRESRTYGMHPELSPILHGELSLKGVDFQENAFLPLNGNWIYNPDALIESGSHFLPTSPTSVSMPAQISQLYDLQEATIASYSLKLTDVPSGIALIAQLPTEREIYRLYCNGFLVSSWQSAPVRLPIAADHTALLVLEIESSHRQRHW
ncbi:MAG: hypothetical protein PHI98_09320 [Eubacteriales bacterium]|nr:hypothetical protein [Eubacteriales bacterium]